MCLSEFIHWEDILEKQAAHGPKKLSDFLEPPGSDLLHSWRDHHRSGCVDILTHNRHMYFSYLVKAARPWPVRHNYMA